MFTTSPPCLATNTFPGSSILREAQVASFFYPRVAMLPVEDPPTEGLSPKNLRHQACEKMVSNLLYLVGISIF